MHLTFYMALTVANMVIMQPRQLLQFSKEKNSEEGANIMQQMAFYLVCSIVI